jgi:nucleoid DNA-binding protein
VVTCTRETISKALKDKLGLANVAEARDILDKVLWEINLSIQAEGEVKLTNFGYFYTLRKKARANGRNPKTGETHAVPERIVLKFRPSKKVMAKLNSSEPSLKPKGMWEVYKGAKNTSTEG